jgi:succinate dehydrogenase / fumarate reductase membrane anchor subunit
MRASKHWLYQRISAVALIFLIPGIWWLSKIFITQPHARLHESISNPIALLLITLAFLFILFHARLGLEIIIEDYTQDTKRKIFLLGLNIALLGLLLLFFAAVTLLLKGH